MTDICSLYPQFKQFTDRRSQSCSVVIDKRSGMDRRQSTRLAVNSDLFNDIKKTEQIFAPFLHKSFNQQVKKYDDASNKNNGIALGALSTIPYARRFICVKDAIQNHDTLKAIGKGLILLINMPEDTRDLVDAGKQLVRLTKKIPPSIPYDYQTKFSFFRGTLLEPVLKWLIESKNERISELGYKIYYLDKSFYDTFIGEKISNMLNIIESDVKNTTRKDIDGRYIEAFKLEGKFIPKLIGRSMQRIPIISLIVFGILELPSIVKSFCNKQKTLKENCINGIKQIIKSSVNVTSIIFSGAILGALFAKKGHIGSLVGLGIGTYLGSKAASYVNEKINMVKI